MDTLLVFGYAFLAKVVDERSLSDTVPFYLIVEDITSLTIPTLQISETQNTFSNNFTIANFLSTTTSTSLKEITWYLFKFEENDFCAY